MKAPASSAIPIAKESTPTILAHHKRQRRWEIALFVSLVFGLLTGFSGLAISAAESLGFLANQRAITRVGVALLLITFPIAIFAAHCLDKAKEVKKTIREEYCRQIGLPDEDHRGQSNCSDE